MSATPQVLLGHHLKDIADDELTWFAIEVLE